MSFRVLIVDDSKLARMGVARALGAIRPDWVRVEAGNADEAVAIVGEAPVNIAILDFNMPGRDGLELAAELHKLDGAMPIAIVSANYQDEIVARSREVGAVFLTKPLTETALASFIDQADARLKAAQQ